jgi:hypothetical protein
MHRVRIDHISPIDAIELKNQLLKDELVINKDFVWEYRQSTYDNDGYDAVTPKQVIFEFQDPALATFYQLKWTR